MIVPLAHVAGVPVEETALALAPAWGGAMVLFAVRARSLRARLRERTARSCERGDGHPVGHGAEKVARR
jgi:hypothetical protein